MGWFRGKGLKYPGVAKRLKVGQRESYERRWRRQRARWVRDGLPTIRPDDLDVWRHKAFTLSHAAFAKWCRMSKNLAWKFKTALNLPGTPVPHNHPYWDKTELGGAPDIAIAQMVGASEDEVRAARDFRKIPAFDEVYNSGQVAGWIADHLELLAQVSLEKPLGFRTAAMAHANQIRKKANARCYEPVPYDEEGAKERLRGLLGLSREESLGFDGARAGFAHRVDERTSRSGHPRSGTVRVNDPERARHERRRLWLAGPDHFLDDAEDAEVDEDGGGGPLDGGLEGLEEDLGTEDRGARPEPGPGSVGDWGLWFLGEDPGYDGDPDDDADLFESGAESDT